MKICVTSSGNSMDSTLDPRFGRANYFIIADTETSEFEAVENVAAKAGGGAGITSGQFMVDKGIEAIITGNVGPNAMRVLSTANINIVRGQTISIEKNIESFKKGLLESIKETVPSHSGMRR